MFGILKGLRVGAEASRLRRRGRRDSKPGSYVGLCRLLVSQGRSKDALDAALEGLDRFPYSAELRELHRHAWRELRSQEIDVLRKKCAETDDAKAWFDLVALHLDCEDFDSAIATTEGWLGSHPDDNDGLLVQAEVLLERFLRDLVAADGRRAITLLNRVIEQADDRFEAHFALTRAYQEIGAVSKALFHAYRALDIDPENDDAQTLYESLVSRKLEEKTVEALLREAEEEADRGGSAENFEIDPARRREVMSGLVRMSQLNGVVRTVFVDSHLSLVAALGEGRMVENSDADPLCAIARGFRDAAAISSRRMGIGALRACHLDAGERTLHFHCVGRTVVVVETNTDGNIDVIRAECSSFVASCLRNEEETVNA